MDNYFSGNILDRGSELRTNKKLINDLFQNPHTHIILFKNLLPLTEEVDGNLKLCILCFGDVAELLEHLKHDRIFLGRERQSDQKAWFAVNFNLDDSEIDILKNIMSPGRSFVAKFFDMFRLIPEHASIVSQAKSVLHWHDRNRFCATCGGKTNMEEAGYKRTCIIQSCRSNKGVHNTCYPRTDPSVIMCVISFDGEKCLLGRKAIFPPKMYSCLAGFVEPGENIEDAVARETKEESGIDVSNIRFVSSQPWPNPASLMLGCIVIATSDKITICEEEMEDVRWFNKTEVQLAIKKQSNILHIPPQQAIAHQLIKYWLDKGHPELTSLL